MISECPCAATAMGLLSRDGGQGLRAPADHADLGLLMSFVTAVGGLSSYMSKRSMVGLVSGAVTSATFGVGALWTSSLGSSPEDAHKHETGHQMSAFASVLFAGAMGYRASANPYVGPGGNMLAALGVASAAYHLTKMLEWQEFLRSRASEAEHLLAEYRDGLPPQARASGTPEGAPSGSALPFGLPRVPPGGY